MDRTQNNSGAKSAFGGYLKAGILQFKDGIIDNNPILVQLLGTCPTLATSTSVTNAIGMGIAATAVLVFSNLIISLLRRIIPKQVRIAAFIIVICGFVSSVELIFKAYLPALDRSLGVFIPLIVVNCIILARAEMFASKNGPLPSALDGLSMGLGFTFGLILLASIRELLGAGTIAGYPVLGESYKPALLFIMPPGAFITLGSLIAVIQKLKNFGSKKNKESSRQNQGKNDSENENAEKSKLEINEKQKTDLKAAQKARIRNEKTEAAAKKKAEKAETEKTEPEAKAETSSAKPDINEKKNTGGNVQ